MEQCASSKAPQAGHTALPSVLIFGAGLLGNLIALFILWLHKLRSRSRGLSVFYALVTALTLTDLLGKCLVSPMVLLSYAKNQTLLELGEKRRLCDLFAFAMLFFGLSSTLILLAMALECWLSLGRPYLYARLVTRRHGVLTAPAVYVFSGLFCAMPFLGFGTYVQYCPGTWCFVKMTEKQPSAGVLGFSLFYGTLMGVLVLAVVLCNLSVMKHLLHMYQKQNRKCCIGNAKTTEAMDHFILLALMTTLFAICSLPLTVLQEYCRCPLRKSQAFLQWLALVEDELHQETGHWTVDLTLETTKQSGNTGTRECHSDSSMLIPSL